MKNYKFFYQPEPITCTIDWCWTFIVLISGIAFWIEVTHINWISIFLILVFFLIAGLELFNRQIKIKLRPRSRQIVIYNMFHTLQNQFSGIHHKVKISQHMIKIDHFQYLISKSTSQRLHKILRR